MISIQIEGLNKAIEAIEVQKGLTESRKRKFLLRLAEAFRDEADVHFSNFALSEWSMGYQYEWTPPIDVTVKAEGDGYAVLAQGEQVAFVEFGAGVFYNGTESYLGTRPPEIVGIGEFGDHKGRQNVWGFYDENHNLVLTRGNPPANAMYFGLEAVEKKVKEIAEAVFK